MLSDYWLLSDLDGTLISTPHKAQGLYLPITRSPALDPIRRWLLNGGNVCVVTTADLRVIEQVYVPLRETLAEAEARCREYHERTARHRGSSSGSGPSASSSASSPGRRPFGGKLLLSLYTGAVLYMCTPTVVQLLPGYTNALHCATREAVAVTQMHGVALPTARRLPDICNSGEGRGGAAGEEEEGLVACVKGTCISRATSVKVQTVVSEIFHQYLQDILQGEPAVLAALKQMSGRYKRMWRAILTFLEHMFLYSKGRTWAVKPPARGADFSILFSGASQSAESQRWKMDFLARCPGFLVALGLLRVEYVEANVTVDADVQSGGAGAADPSAQGLSSSSSSSSSGGRASSSQRKPSVASRSSSAERARIAAERRRQQERADEALVVGHATSILMKGVPEGGDAATLHPVVERFAAYMTSLLGTDPRDLKKRLSASPQSFNDVAQVIVLGLPLALFSRYFLRFVPAFVQSGVQALAQPNSVVFCKTGISKSTTLRYLLGKERVAESSSSRRSGCRSPPPSSPSPSPAEAQCDDFAACVRPDRAVSLGDNPHTTDYELTVFSDVKFISVEKRAQREERHKRIQRRLLRTKAVEDRGDRPKLPDGSPAPSYAELVAAQTRSGSMMDDRLLPHILYVGAEEEGVAIFLTTLMDQLRVPPLLSSTGHVRPEEGLVSERAFQRGVVNAQGRARRKVDASLFSKL